MAKGRRGGPKGSVKKRGFQKSTSTGLFVSTDPDVLFVNAAGGSESDDADGGTGDYYALDGNDLSEEAVDELATAMLRDAWTSQRDNKRKGPYSKLSARTVRRRTQQKHLSAVTAVHGI